MRDYSHMTDEEKRAEAAEVDRIFAEAGFEQDDEIADGETVIFVAPLLRDRKPDA